jgi:xylulokinase
LEADKNCRKVMKYILAIDMGTTAFKAAVYSEDGNECGSATIEYVIQSPKPGWAEADVSLYEETFKKSTDAAIKKAGISAEDIFTIGMSVQGETSIFLDSSNRVLRPAIVWFDTRAASEAKEIVEKFGSDAIQKHTGQVGEDAIWPGAKLIWLKKNEPEVFSKIDKILQLNGYFGYMLTGKTVGEDSILGSSVYWDINTRSYWSEMLDYIGITENQLPEICRPGECIGHVTSEAAEKFGFSENTTVNIGGIDLACGAIGSGNTKPGSFSESIGTALCTMTMVDHIVHDPSMQMPCYCSAIPGLYMVHAYATGGLYIKWFRDTFCETEKLVEKDGGMNAYDQLDMMAAEVSAGADGLIALPHLQGSGPPDLFAAAKACFYGITIAHEKKHFVRAIMESVAMVLCRIIEATEALDVDVRDIISIGGGTMSQVWCQIKADATGRKLITTKNNESACCLGAAILAGVSSGVWTSVDEACKNMIQIEHIYEPDRETNEIYADLLKKYKKLMKCIRPMSE